MTEQRWRPVVLTARREIVEHGTDRRFALGTAVVLFIVVAIIVAPAMVQRTPKYDIGLAPGAVSLGDTLRTEAAALDVAVSTKVAPEGQLAEQLRDGPLDGYVAADSVLHVADEPPPDLRTVVTNAVAGQRARDLLADAGVDAELADQLLTQQQIEISYLEEPDARSAEREGIARMAVFLLFGQIATYAFWVASGVVEEKSSRVVEVVLSAIRPWQLLAGKILGLGLLGFCQLMVVGGAALTAAVVTRGLQLDGDLALALLPSLGGYLLGFTFYGSLYAAAAATVSRHEELGAVTGVIQMLLMGSLLLAFNGIDQSSTLSRLTSLVPMTSPLTVPPRIAAGTASPAEVLLSAALLVATILVIVPAAGRLYTGAILQTGARVRLRHAWRPDTTTSSGAPR